MPSKTPPLHLKDFPALTDTVPPVLNEVVEFFPQIPPRAKTETNPSAIGPTNNVVILNGTSSKPSRDLPVLKDIVAIFPQTQPQDETVVNTPVSGETLPLPKKMGSLKVAFGLACERILKAYDAAGNALGYAATHKTEIVQNFVKGIWDKKYELVASGAASKLAKAGTIVCLAPFMSAATSVAAAAMIVGGATSIARHIWKHRNDTAKQRAETKCFSAGTLTKKFAIGVGVGLVGGAIGGAIASWLNPDSGLTQCFNSHGGLSDASVAANQPHAITGTAAASAADVPAPAASAPAITVQAPTVTPEVVTPLVAPTAPASPLEAIKQYAASNEVSPKLKEALLRADSANPGIRAQALDDISVYAPKGLRAEGYELLKEAAAAGNLKAQVDLTVLQFDGSKALGVASNPDAAIEKMAELSKHSKYAANVLREWIGNPPPPSVRELVKQAHEAAANITSAIDVTPEPVTATPVPDCTTTFDVTDSSKMTMSCAVNGAEPQLEVGEVITVQRPALLNALAPR